VTRLRFRAVRASKANLVRRIELLPRAVVDYPPRS